MRESRRLVAPGAPHVRDARSVASLTRCLIIALLPVVAVGLWNTGRQAASNLSALGDRGGGWRFELLERFGSDPASASVPGQAALGALYMVPLLLVAIAAALAWEHAFARLRQRPAGEGAATSALIFTLLLPPATPLMQAALGMSFGMIFGRLVFGGVGRTFLHPAVMGLAFLAVSQPHAVTSAPLFPGVLGFAGTDVFARATSGDTGALGSAGLDWMSAFIGREPARLGESSALACLLGAAWLVLQRAASWRVMAGVAFGALGTGVVWNLVTHPASPPAVPAHWHLVLGGLAFVAVFVATDAPSTASTHGGRWIAGLLVGTLTVLLRMAHRDHPDGVVPAVLLASIAAPLLDHAAVHWTARRRARRGARARNGWHPRMTHD